MPKREGGSEEGRDCGGWGGLKGWIVPPMSYNLN